LWRSLSQGLWLQQVFACVIFPFSFSSPLERYIVTNMHSVHNAIYLLMNKVANHQYANKT
jgi:hypothetical protein